MGIALHHLCNLLLASWSNLVSALGTTSFALFVALSIVIASVALVGWRQGFAVMRAHFSQTLKDGLILTVIVYLLLYGGSFVWTTYQDHQQLVERATKLRHELTITTATMQQQIAALQQKPDFIIALGQSYSFFDKRYNTTAVLLNVTITNKGAKSSPVGWSAHYASPMLDQDATVVMPFRDPWIVPMLDPVTHEAIALSLGHDDFIENVGAIERGDIVGRRILLGVPGNVLAALNNGTGIITLTARDYLGNIYKAKWSGRSRPVTNLEMNPQEKTRIPSK